MLNESASTFSSIDFQRLIKSENLKCCKWVKQNGSDYEHIENEGLDVPHE